MQSQYLSMNSRVFPVQCVLVILRLALVLFFVAVAAVYFQ